MGSPQVNGTNLQKSFKYHSSPLWSGPSILASIRTGKVASSTSLLDPNYRDTSAINKQLRQGTVRLNRLGFQDDEQAFFVHGGPTRAVLQYNLSHYDVWRDELTMSLASDPTMQGGFGENITVQNVASVPTMDERTMCIGDLVGFRRVTRARDIPQVKMRVTGPRMPCYKLNHRFGTSDMSQRAQDRFWTGWFYSVDCEGEVQVGDELVLLERPFPDWPVARVQHYLFKEPKNTPVLEEILATISNFLVDDVRKTFEKRSVQGLENMSMRLQGKDTDLFVRYCLRRRRQETMNVAELVFDRVDKIRLDSPEFVIAEPGAHLRLRFSPHDQGSTQYVRPYSVISGDSNTFNLGIALADNSRGGSTFLHRNLQPGDILEVSSKFVNTFHLQSPEVADNHIFIAGGIGITAFLGHIKRCVDERRRFHLHYLIRTKSDYAFERLIEKLLTANHTPSTLSTKDDGANAPTNDSEDIGKDIHHTSLTSISVYTSSEGRRCNVKQVLAEYAKDTRTHFYVCGGEKLSDAIKKAAASLDIMDSRLQFEQFSVDASGDPFTVELERSKRRVEVSSQQSLLDALREAGLDTPSSCEAGNCATCKVRVKNGRILHRGTGLSEGEKAASSDGGAGEMLTCVSRGVGTITLDL